MTVSVSQFVVGTDASGSGANAAVTLTPVAGDSMHVLVTQDSGHTISSFASVPSQTWTLRDSVTDSGNSQIIAHYTADNAVGGSTTITATFNAASTFRAIVGKVINGTSGYDSVANSHAGQVQNFPTTVADATTSGNTPALSAQPALASGFCMDSSGGATPAAGTGFTNDGIGVLFGGATNLVRGESKRVTAISALAATFTAGLNEAHGSLVAVFLEGGGAANNQLAWVRA